MEENDSATDLTAPEETRRDKAHKVGKVVAGGAAGLIAAASGSIGGALIAGTAQGLVEIFFRNPLEDRKDAWLREVSGAIEEIQERLEEEDATSLVERLTSDPEFITTLHQATDLAFRTHQKEKLQALRNALVNSAAPGAPEMDLRSVFLRLFDQLSPSHLRILEVLNDPLPALERTDGFSSLSRRSTSLAMGDMVVSALPDLRKQPWQVFVQHLSNEGLLEAAGEPSKDTWFDTLLPKTTDFGRNFLEFVCDSEDHPGATAIRGKAAVLEDLRAELKARGRTQRFEVGPIRRVAIEKGAEPVITDIVVRFPRESARNPVANGNPPSVAEARISVLSDSVLEVFSFDTDPEFLGAEPLGIQIDEGYVIEGELIKEAGRAADKIVELLEKVFPNRRYWK